MKEKIKQVLQNCLNSLSDGGTCSLKSYGDCPSKRRMYEYLKQELDIGKDYNAYEAIYALRDCLERAVTEKPCGDTYVVGCERVNEVMRYAEQEINDIEQDDMTLVKIEVKGNIPRSCKDCRIGRGVWPTRCPLNGEYQAEYGYRPEHCPLTTVS